MTTESLIQNQIRVGLSKAGHTVFRVNVGKVKMQNGRWFETGVPKGYCDLSGFRKGDAKAFFIEVFYCYLNLESTKTPFTIDSFCGLVLLLLKS